MASSWQEHFGYKTGPFTGMLEDAGGNPVDTRHDDATYGIGFGPGDLRKARRQGWTAISLLEYLKGPGGRGVAGQQSPYERDTGGRGVVPQSVINELRQDEAIQKRMETGWNKWTDILKDYTKTSDLPEAPDLSDYAKTADVQANTQNIQKAMLEAQKVRQNNPYAVVGNTAMGIQQKESPSQVAGQISAGLAGFSRNQKKFKNKTLNV